MLPVGVVAFACHETAQHEPLESAVERGVTDVVDDSPEHVDVALVPLADSSAVAVLAWNTTDFSGVMRVIDREPPCATGLLGIGNWLEANGALSTL